MVHRFLMDSAVRASSSERACCALTLCGLPKKNFSITVTKNHVSMTPMIIPHHALKPETFKAMVEDFVTRDGTDYGDYEVALSLRVKQVQDQIESGKALIIFDTAEQTFSIVPSDTVEGAGKI